jgi:alpha-methylacyl-CoA racemase
VRRKRILHAGHPIERTVVPATNARDIRLDLKSNAGKTTFLRLVRASDVVFEGFRPGVMERLGLAYETLRLENPRVVYCALTGYGHDGPYRDAPGHDINYCALAGVVDGTGNSETPALSNFALSDLLGGTLCAMMGILAALLDAQRTGCGRFVDVAISDGVLAHSILGLSNFLRDGAMAARGTGSHTGGHARYGLYRTADDRFVAVGARERQFWNTVCAIIGRSELGEDYGALPERDAIVRNELSIEFRKHPLSYWMRAFHGQNACVTPVLTLPEALADEHFRARGMVFQDEQGLPSFAFPVKMSNFAFEVGRESPKPGEHTIAVLRDFGFSGEEIARLEAQHVV